MNALIGKAPAVFLSSVALSASGLLWVGHRLTRNHYQGVIARIEQRHAVKRRKLSEVAAQAQIDAEKRIVQFQRQGEEKLASIDHQYQQELQHAKTQNVRTSGRVGHCSPPVHRYPARQLQS